LGYCRIGSGTQLDRIGYVSNDWQTILLGFPDKEVKESWELLNASEGAVSLVDIALQPFSNRVWGITGSKILYCYSLDEEMVEDVDFLSLRTVGSEVGLEFESKHILLGEAIQIDLLHLRPLQDINKYRIWYQTPAGTKYGLLNGSQVSYSSDEVHYSSSFGAGPSHFQYCHSPCSFRLLIYGMSCSGVDNPHVVEM